MPPDEDAAPQEPVGPVAAAPTARPTWLRWTVYAGIALSVALVASGLAAVRAVRDALPQTDGTVTVAGLRSEVTIRRDDAGVPHVYADDPDSLFFGQGYVQAQDRFAQMDLRRLAAEGRLSELFGSETLERDKLARTLDWERIAQRELRLLSPRTVARLKAFSDGVNAYLRDRDPQQLSLEYDLLRLRGVDHEPDRWTPVDSLMWFQVASWDLGVDVGDEVDRVMAATVLSVPEVDELYPVPDHTAGNAWVVSGERTDSGAPYLLADPHDRLTLPGQWYQVGLHCTEVTEDCPFDVSGFAMPGVPGVQNGRNADISWASVGSGADVADLYLEAVDGATYLRGRRWVEFGSREEVISVLGEEPFVYEPRTTTHGPVLSDVDRTYASVGANAPDGGYDRRLDDVLGSVSGIPRGDYAVSLAWTALRPTRSLEAVLAVNAAGDWEEFRSALADFAPQRQFVYADRAGHIGLQASGTVPVRRDGRTGDYPASGWERRQDWRAEPVPAQQLASAFDPPGGVAIAGTTGLPSYPARRLQQLLSEQSGLSTDDVVRIQQDTRHGFAARLVPILLQQDVGDGVYWRGAQVLLRDWDYHQPVESAAASYFNAVLSNLLVLTFSDQLPASVEVTGGERWWVVLDRLLDRPRSPWWDDVTTEDVRETRDEVLVRAMRDARDELTRLQSRTATRWTWGHQHTLTLENPTFGQSDSALIDRLLNRGEWEVPGGSDAVVGGDYDPAQGYEVTRSSAFRMMVSWEDPDASTWVLPGGASGHAFSEHYTDQVESWARGEDRPWPSTPEAVQEATEETLVLEPGR